jgi:thiol-disulfide isomerase/thioredoxin
MNKIGPPSSRERRLKRIPAILILGFLSYRLLSMYNFKAPKQLDRSTLDLRGVDGQPIDPNELLGKTLILNYWAPWCGPCRLEMPWLERLQTDHKTDVLVVGVVADSNEYSAAPQFMRLHGFDYVLAEESSGLRTQIGGVSVLPTTFYVTPSGAVIHTVTGMIPEMLMKRYTADAMRQK